MEQRDWYLHEQVEPDIPPPAEALGDVGGTCFSVAAGTVNFNIDPSQFSGTQDGDYVILVCIGNESPQSGETKCKPSMADPESYGWSVIYAGIGSAEGSWSILGRFIETGDTSLAYQLSISSSAEGLFCWYAHAWRDVSRRLPLDYLMRGYIEGHGFESDRLNMPDQRQHGTLGAWFNAVMYTATTSGNLWEYGDTYRISAANIPVGITYRGANTRRADVIESVARKRRIYNLLASQNTVGGWLNWTGWGKVNVEELEIANGDRRMTTMGAVRDGTSKQYYVSRSYNMVAGHSYYIRLKHLLRVSSSNDYYLVFAVAPPSGGLVGSSIGAGANDTGGDLGGALTLPPWRTGFGQGHSGLPDTLVGEYMMRFDCTETGVHQLRVYVVSAAVGALTWNAGGTAAPLQTNVGPVALAIVDANTGMPSLMATVSGGDPYYDDMVNGLFYERPASAMLRTLNTNYAPFAAQVLKDTEPFDEPVRLIAAIPWAVRHRLNADLTGIDNATQPYRWTPSGLDSRRVALLADRCLPPHYRLTEGGAQQSGRYYWEANLVGVSSSDDFGWGIVAVSNPAPRLTNGVVTPERVQSMILANGATTTGSSTAQTSTGGALANGDVLGFALDILAGELEIYKNGVLLTTLIINGDHAPLRLHWWRACAVHDQDEATGTTMTWNFNFRGPFTHAKPSGYVAYDFLNEVP